MLDPDQLIDQLDASGGADPVKQFDMGRYRWPDLFWWLR
jgi:hypothetical protein